MPACELQRARIRTANELGEPGAAGSHAAARRPGAPSAVTSDPLPWRARAQPKLRSEIIPSTPEPATEHSTEPSLNKSKTAALSVSEKCPTTDQRAPHGKLTNHGA
jgi:hypothetical protein